MGRGERACSLLEQPHLHHGVAQHGPEERTVGLVHLVHEVQQAIVGLPGAVHHLVGQDEDEASQTGGRHDHLFLGIHFVLQRVWQGDLMKERNNILMMF